MPPFQPTSPCPLLKCQHLFLRFYMNRTVCMCVHTSLCTHGCVCMCVHVCRHVCICLYVYLQSSTFFYNPTLIISMLLSESVFFSLILFFLNHSEDPFHQCSGLSWISSLLYLKQLPPFLAILLVLFSKLVL